MFEQQRRADSKQWKRKDQKRPCSTKRTISSKKMYATFFNSSGPVVQVPCPSGHTVTGRFYKCSVLKKVKEFYSKKRPSKGWSGVHLLHDNASSHKCEVVKSFLASEKVKLLNHPPYLPDQSPKEEYLSALRDWVKRVRLQKCVSVKGGILWRFVIKICLIKHSTEVIRTQWQNFLQDPRNHVFHCSFIEPLDNVEFIDIYYKGYCLLFRWRDFTDWSGFYFLHTSRRGSRVS